MPRPPDSHYLSLSLSRPASADRLNMDRITECADNVRRFLISSYLDGPYKEKVHITQLLLVALMIILWDTSIAV